MSIIQHSWQKSQNVIPGNQEVVWVVDDQGKVNLVVHQERNGESYLSWRFFGTRDFLYGHRWWQKTSSNLDPRPEPPRPEAAQEGVYGPGDPPNMAPLLPPTPTKQRYHMTTTKGPTDCCPGCWECDPSRFDPPAGCQGDPDENPDRVNAPEPLGEPANIRTELAQLRTELAQLRADLMAVCKFLHDPDGLSVVTIVEKMNSALKTVSKHVLALDSHQKQVDARLDEIEKHTDFSHNSK